MRETALLELLVDTTSDYPSWSVLRQAVRDGRPVHLAVMVEPFLSYIMDGKKSIESRFSKHAIAPFYQIEPGDLVLLKPTGGPVVGCFDTDAVEFVALNEEERDRLQRRYSAAICADDDFWHARQDKRYATLVGVHNVHVLEPAPVAKSDRRGWVVLQPRSGSACCGR
ncbi:MAG: ASCH domain-containing protein [Pseudonocardiaceae bacterium]